MRYYVSAQPPPCPSVCNYLLLGHNRLAYLSALAQEKTEKDRKAVHIAISRLLLNDVGFAPIAARSHEHVRLWWGSHLVAYLSPGEGRHLHSEPIMVQLEHKDATLIDCFRKR